MPPIEYAPDRRLLIRSLSAAFCAVPALALLLTAAVLASQGLL